MSPDDPPKLRAGIYCRASSDPRERGLSVETQEEDGRKWCADNGYDVAWVVVDNDFSASLWAAKDRPGYTEVQRKLAGADPVDVLVARDASRLQRDLEVYVQVRALCAQYGVLWAYNGRTYDLSRTDDRFTTGLDALLAERRASETRDDVVQAVRKRVRTGRPHGRIAYGYRQVYDPHTGTPIARELDSQTAWIVRRIIGALLAGSTVYAIAADLDRHGVPAPEAVRRWRRGIVGPSLPWTHRAVRQIALNPTYAGLRTHNPGEKGKGEERRPKIVGKGDWPAIVPESDHYEVVALLTDPRRRTSQVRAAKHLLSGIAVCDVCGSVCGHIQNRGAASYACKGNMLTWRGSRHVTRRQAPVDAYVIETILHRLARPDAVELFAVDPDNSEAEEVALELTRLETRLEAFRLSAEDPDGISPESLARMEAKYLPLIEQARARAVPRHVPPVVRELAAASDVWAHWEGLDVRERRQVVRNLVVVTILKSTRPHGSKGFDTGSVEIRWRGDR